MNSPTVAIFKFNLDTKTEIQRIRAPYIVRVLDVQLQDGRPVMWALVWPDSPIREYVILCKMTGDNVVGATCHLRTIQLKNGIVLHYFGGGPGLSGEGPGL